MQLTSGGCLAVGFLRTRRICLTDVFTCGIKDLFRIPEGLRFTSESCGARNHAEENFINHDIATEVTQTTEQRLH